MKERLEKSEAEHPQKLVVGDVPLLFETGGNRMFSEVMVVYVPEHVQLERLIRRDKLAPDEARRRIAAQMSIEEKKKRADYVIDNSGSLAQTEEQVEHFWKRKGLP
jgi:dephospho-CoA kinase